MHSNIGYIATLCLNLSLLLPLKTNAKVDNYVIVLTNSYWVLTGIWWCKSSCHEVVALTKEFYSYIPTTSTRSSSPKGPALCNHWLEAGKLFTGML